MKRIIKPYGFIQENLIKEVWTWNGRYFIRDISGNRFEINEETYKELEHDRT